MQATPARATITYSIWGDPAEIKSQQAVVDAFHAVNPKITVKVTVSDWDTYWDKLQTGIAGVMRRTSSPWTDRCSPTTSRATSCST